MYKLFLESPNELKNSFEDNYKIIYPDNSINNIGIGNGKYCADEEFVEFSKKHKIDKKIYFLKQRTKKWFDLLKYHRCGNNSVKIGFELKERYHLLRGIIGEYVVQNKLKYILENVGYKKFKFVEVGMIVEDKNIEKSEGSSPDGLLWNEETKEIGIIEIKCLRNENINGNYFRELNLSNLQLKRSKEILNYEKITLLMSLLCWFKNGEMVIDIFINEI